MVTNTVVPMSTRDDQRHGPDHITKTKLSKSVPEASPHQATGPRCVHVGVGYRAQGAGYRVGSAGGVLYIGMCYI